MNKEDRKQKWKKQTNELYCAIGEFVVEFEHACDSVQKCILFLLQREGLKNQKVALVLVAGLTADPLMVLLKSLIAETRTQNDNEKKIINNVFSRFKNLIETRNNIIHGKWYIGWGSEEDDDFSIASGAKNHKSGSGCNIKNFSNKAEDFQKSTQEAQKLKDIFLRLNGCFDGGYKIEKNFIWNSEGNVSVP